MYRTVIFDLDGTVLDTIQDLKNAANFVCREHGWPEYTTEEVKAMVGHGMKNLVTRFSPEEFRDPRTIEQTLGQYMDYYGRHCMEETAPFSGIAALLKELKEKKLQLAVYSNKADEFTGRMIEHYFPNVFDLARGKREGVPVKPDPEGIRMVLQELNAVPEETLYVGDSNVDIQTGHNGNLKACGVTWGFRSRESLAEAGADYLADTVEELRTVILGE